jgi:hypothetical protein
MTTTKPSQKDHLQRAVDVLEAENAELRQIAAALLLQIQGLRGAGCYRESAGMRSGSKGGPVLAVARCYRQKRLRGPEAVGR